MECRFQRLSCEAKIPTFGTTGSCGLDLHVINEDSVIFPGQIKEFKTGLAVQLPANTFGKIEIRSGLAWKHGLQTLAGVIDEDYRGEVKILIKNLGEEPVKMVKGMRAAQMVIIPYCKAQKISDMRELSISDRGVKGLGSTGLF